MQIVTETPVTLAWIGDAIYSLKVRRHLFAKGLRNSKQLQKSSAAYCSAFGQARVLEKLEPELTEDELEIVRRGKNAHVKTLAKNQDPKDYLKATALEALFGYLDLYGEPERMEELLERCMKLGEME